MKLAELLWFFIHTVAVYVCAVHVSPIIIGRWFAWLAPSAELTQGASAGNWYLQHLEIVTLIPASLFGFLFARWQPSSSTWAWVVPTIMLCSGLIIYSRPHSVFGNGGPSGVAYFFEIQRFMPTAADPFVSDARRVYKQMFVTAPFYAGISYSIAAWLAKASRKGSRSLASSQ
jgi:hypothetical protein